jgi:plastocyanin
MRTFAMSVVTAGFAVIVAVFLFFLFVLILPQAAKDPQAGAFVPVIGGFIVVFAALGAASLLWPGARRRSWFWLVCAIPGVLVLLLFAPDITRSIAHPTDAQSFVPTILALLGAASAIVGGIAAFLDVRRGRPTWTRTGRAGIVVTAIAFLAVGSVATSLAAGGGGGGGGVAQAPTTTAVQTAQGTKYLVTTFQMKNGDVLGLFVVNKDSTGHSFDIDSLNIHVSLPANSTTAVSIKPTGAGALEFYCAIPGHKAAGMDGTITVGT